MSSHFIRPSPATLLLTKPRRGLVVGSSLILVAIATTLLITDPVAQNIGYHAFADQRHFYKLANAADVLSNAIFMLAGVLGFWSLHHHRQQLQSQLTAYSVLFLGLLLTSLGSSYYHLNPSNATLFWDRLPMTLCFMSLMALVISERIDEELGRHLLPWLVGVGIASVVYWGWRDDLRPYLLVQFVPLLSLPFILLRWRGPGSLWLWLMLGCYGLAKVAELHDGALFQLSGELVSGHTLKHLAAGLGGLMLVCKVQQSAAAVPLDAGPQPLISAGRWSLPLADLLMALLGHRYASFVFLLRRLSPALLEQLGQALAFRAYQNTRDCVPAYQAFTATHRIRRWDEIPVMDKGNYIKRYATELRCQQGKIPLTHVMIDESSGSTGTPFNWVRSATERAQSHRVVSYFSNFCYGTTPRWIINAFSMGAWATGLNMGVAMERNGIVKNTGPDIDKILSTLDLFGPDHTYLIAGYPPFLKRLADEAHARGLPWSRYQVDALAGGEGMSEGLRHYLQRSYRAVYSGYGATDLEIGIGGETPLTVTLRQLAQHNARVRELLFGGDSRLPMIFQYNPLMHWIEVSADGELIITINRRTVLSPRIRYNIHDQGGVIRYDQLRDKLRSLGIDLDALQSNPRNQQGLSLPLFWVFGRSDYTLSIMGANIYPEDIEQSVYADDRLAAITRSYCQSLAETDEGSMRPEFYFEITEPPTESLRTTFEQAILRHLLNVNRDFKKAWQEYPAALQPIVQLFSPASGPFRADGARIKQVRLLGKATASFQPCHPTRAVRKEEPYD